MEKAQTVGRLSGGFLTAIVALMLLGLPLAAWLDVRNLSEERLTRQATDLNSVISSVRGFYASNVVSRVLAAHGETQVSNNYEAIPGAIPIPATLSLELGKVIREQQKSITYRFVSDFPFRNRAPHTLDDFEIKALALLRNNPNAEQQTVESSAGAGSDADHHGGGVCGLPQQPSGKSQTRLENWRCARHSGSQHQPVLRHQYFLVQIPDAVFRADLIHRRGLSDFATAAGGADSGHE